MPISTDLRLRAPSTLIIAAPSGTGKTRLAVDIVCDSENIYTKVAKEVLWVYSKLSENHALFKAIKEKLQKQKIPITFKEGMPEDDITSHFRVSRDAHKILCIDDLFLRPDSAAKRRNGSGVECSQFLENLFNIVSHHHNISVILIMQNLYAATPTQRSCLNSLLRSCVYLVLGICRTNLPIVKTIGRNFFGIGDIDLFFIYQELMKEAVPHSYLVIDFVTGEPSLTVRERGIRPTESSYAFHVASSSIKGQRELKKIEIIRKHADDKKESNEDEDEEAKKKVFERALLQLLPVNESGFVVYTHMDDAEGSSVRSLLNYILYGEGNKPLDTDLFKNYVKKHFNVDFSTYYVPSIRKRKQSNK
jgi:hypothetical protein